MKTSVGQDTKPAKGTHIFTYSTDSVTSVERHVFYKGEVYSGEYFTNTASGITLFQTNIIKTDTNITLFVFENKLKLRDTIYIGKSYHKINDDGTVYLRLYGWYDISQYKNEEKINFEIDYFLFSTSNVLVVRNVPGEGEIKKTRIFYLKNTDYKFIPEKNGKKIP